MTTMPYASSLAEAANMGELHQLWATFSQPSALHNTMEALARQGVDWTRERIGQQMAADWEARGAEIKLASTTGPTEKQVVTAGQRLAEIDDESLQAVLDYGLAVEEYAKKHATHKSTRARRYMALKGEASAKGEKLTDGMAETMADADEMVALLYFQSELNEAKMKAAKALLDHLQRSFDYHRSLFARESRMDSR